MIEDDCYVKYEPILNPLLRKAIKNYSTSFKYQRPTETFTLGKMQGIFPTYDLVRPFIHDCQIKLKRNYQNTKFSNVMSVKERGELT